MALRTRPSRILTSEQKAAKAARNRAWRAANPEKAAAAVARWQAANPEKVAALQRRAYLKRPSEEKAAKAARQRAWRAANPEKVAAIRHRERARNAANPEKRAAAVARTLAWQAANPEKWAATQRRARLKREYKITEAEYAARLAAQNGVCAICERSCSTYAVLSVDHDHDTNQVRGLLCNSCNTGLGRFRDSPKKLRAAAQYLEGH